MRPARRPHRATHRPPNAASTRGLLAAHAALYGEHPPMPADEQAEAYRALQQVPYRKRQGDLALVLPEPEPR